MNSTDVAVAVDEKLEDMDSEVGSAWIAQFHGVVHPQNDSWQIEKPIVLLISDSTWTLIVKDSMFRVLVQGPLRTDAATFRNEVMSVLRGVLDSLGFHVGVALTPELHGFFAFIADHSAAMVGVPEVGWSELTGRDPSVRLQVSGDELEPFVSAAAEAPLIRLALADLAMAIERPDDTGFYAYRAVESARQYFRSPTDSDDRDIPWSRLHAALAFTKDELLPLAQAAKSRRHGEVQPITETQRLEALRLARDVIGRLVGHHAERAGDRASSDENR